MSTPDGAAIQDPSTFVRVAKQKARQRDRIDTEIMQRAAALRRVEKTALRIEGLLPADIRLQPADFANHTIGECFARGLDRGQIAAPHLLP